MFPATFISLFRRNVKIKIFNMNSNFFKNSNYFIDEKVNLFKFENCYKVFDDKGEIIGNINQKIPIGLKILSLIINKAFFPFRLEIRDTNNTLLSSINRGWTFFISKITVEDAEKNVLGVIKQKFKLFKPIFEIYDTSEKMIAIISGDWKAWNFEIKNPSDMQIGTINKKWGGAMKEIFTTADKYNVNINNSITNETAKLVVVSCAITIDMVLKERK